MAGQKLKTGNAADMAVLIAIMDRTKRRHMSVSSESNSGVVAVVAAVAVAVAAVAAAVVAAAVVAAAVVAAAAVVVAVAAVVVVVLVGTEQIEAGYGWGRTSPKIECCCLSLCRHWLRHDSIWAEVAFMKTDGSTRMARLNCGGYLSARDCCHRCAMCRCSRLSEVIRGIGKG